MALLVCGLKASPPVISSGFKSAIYTCGGIRNKAAVTSTLTGTRNSAFFTCQGTGLVGSTAGSASAAWSGVVQQSNSAIRSGLMLLDCSMANLVS